jgi:RTX calcium-binding nonapeptide repeat (4 copies)
MAKRSKILACLLTTMAISVGFAVSAVAGPATSARGRAYGAKLLNVAELPNAQAQVPPGASDHDETNAVAADLSPLVTAGAFHVEGDGSTTSNVAATMQATIDSATSASLPGSWNARGYAHTTNLNVGSLGPGLPTLSASVLNAEAVSACVNGSLVHGSAAQVAGLSLITPPAVPGLPGTPIPITSPSATQPNQVLLDALGIKLTFWETNWNPVTLGTTNGSSTVFTNAVHLVTPLGDVIISHAESTAQCGTPPPPPGGAQCEDGVDNDGDGQIDMADPECSSPTDNSEDGSGGDTPRCQDGIDNDGDGLIDLDDPDCSSPTDDSEDDNGGDTPRCSDGIDNDGDGLIDLDDPDCSSPEDDSESSNGGGGGNLPRPCRKAGAIVGTSGKDRLKGTPGRDIICGLAGRDVIRGRGGADKIFGHKGNDKMFGQGGKDKIRGKGGKDRFKGGRGRDRLYGNKGNDKLRGNAGRDRIAGNGGRDTLAGGGGRDLCRPGSGHNRMRSCELTR